MEPHRPLPRAVRPHPPNVHPPRPLDHDREPGPPSGPDELPDRTGNTGRSEETEGIRDAGGAVDLGGSG
ncbi:hypothetical protein ACFWF4_29775, partial [Nocardiopsis flavescens]|uniref:hypothetical protein n=1 Tax=Nocardiopsis flavescens TaxID=758803 RepID=UPI0036461FCB